MQLDRGVRRRHRPLPRIGVAWLGAIPVGLAGLTLILLPQRLARPQRSVAPGGGAPKVLDRTLPASDR